MHPLSLQCRCHGWLIGGGAFLGNRGNRSGSFHGFFRQNQFGAWFLAFMVNSRRMLLNGGVFADAARGGRWSFIESRPTRKGTHRFLESILSWRWIRLLPGHGFHQKRFLRLSSVSAGACAAGTVVVVTVVTEIAGVIAVAADLWNIDCTDAFLHIDSADVLVQILILIPALLDVLVDFVVVIVGFVVDGAHTVASVGFVETFAAAEGRYRADNMVADHL